MSGRLLLGLLASTIAVSAEQQLVEGRTESKVRVLIYEDLQCPDCAEFRRMMDEKILPRYGERVAFIHVISLWRSMPGRGRPPSPPATSRA